MSEHGRQNFKLRRISIKHVDVLGAISPKATNSVVIRCVGNTEVETAVGL